MTDAEELTRMWRWLGRSTTACISTMRGFVFVRDDFLYSLGDQEPLFIAWLKATRRQPTWRTRDDVI